MNVFQYPALQDNYNWVITCPETRECAGVDIYDTEPLFNYIEQNNLKLTAVLNTHHHHDHTGGNKEIAKKFKNIRIYGSEYDFANKRIEKQTDSLKEGSQVKVGNISFSVIEIPGHTLGHICYFNKQASFVGDTLFASGCGRLFEGSAAQMYNSFEKLISNLNHQSPVYCGHEYTLANLKFSCSLNQQYFQEYYNEVAELRKNNRMTVPTKLEKELKFNPFMMAREPGLRKEILHLTENSGVEAFTVLRKKKDNF